MSQQVFGPVSTAPYSSGIVAGEFAFVSGQIGRDASTGEIADGVAEQTRVTLANLAGVLADAGLALDDVVKTTVFLTDMSTFEEMNAVYREAFPAPLPARSTIGVAALPALGLRVEIEAIARVPDAKAR